MPVAMLTLRLFVHCLMIETEYTTGALPGRIHARQKHVQHRSRRRASSHEIWPVHSPLMVRSGPVASKSHLPRVGGADSVRRGAGLRCGLARGTPLYALRHRALG